MAKVIIYRIYLKILKVQAIILEELMLVGTCALQECPLVWTSRRQLRPTDSSMQASLAMLFGPKAMRPMTAVGIVP